MRADLGLVGWMDVVEGFRFLVWVDFALEGSSRAFSTLTIAESLLDRTNCLRAGAFFLSVDGVEECDLEGDRRFEEEDSRL